MNLDLLTFNLRVHTAEEVYTMEIDANYTKAVTTLNSVRMEGQVTIAEKGLKGSEIIKVVPYHAITLFEIVVAEKRVK
jgi:hypothetical protein